MESNYSTSHLSVPTTVDQLPVRLRDLLKREVCLALSYAQIESALAEVEQESRDLKKTRPPFLFLHAKPTRAEFENRQAGSLEAQVALRQGLKDILDVQPRLRAWVEDDLETFLRDSQTSYLHGLATHRYPDDWQRAITRFDQRVVSFRASLTNLQNVLPAVPAGTVLSYYAPAFEKLMPARQWGALLDYEFLFFNRLADEQRRSSSLGGSTFRRTPDNHFSAQVGQWARLDAEQVRRGLLELRARLELAVMDARVIYVTEATLAQGNTHGPRSFVYPAWETLRQLIRLEVASDEVESIVNETERMVALAS
jgi:hypothetical protein